MPEFCTCGARLPEDALFCHKCGKPQREIVEPETVAPVQLPVADVQAPLAALEPVPLNFHNGTAIRISLLVAAIATLLSFLPYLNWLAAGFFAVFFYRRRTGYLLNMESGVRMGWMTGLMMFTIMAAFLCISVLFLRSAGGMAMFQSEFKTALDPKVLETLKMLQNGTEIAKLLLQLFVFTTLLSMAGGALGAKMVGRN
ncbi:MAG TPA: zinc ribbon domain-containing protein [Bryobacteraceae bacterium]|jgi:hypothetical protein